ncbi:MAG: energy-coupling factor ABC transporter permease [Bryobacteraceae bacterium]|nr:energy-coupling factor ABC transporter permease [Bryobacteraceae bacterium]
MHIPDGFLATPVWAAFDVISLPAVGWIARQTRTSPGESRTPLLGILGAFVFAAQMINFPIAPGTSAHLLGGALLAATVGPFAAIIVLTAVLAIQALVFQDGGLLAFGANVFNIAIAGSLAGYAPIALFRGQWQRVGLFLGGLISVLLSGSCALAQLVLSSVTMPQQLLGGALILFVVNGLIEGVITVVVVEAIARLSPARVQPGRPSAGLVALGITAVLLAGTGFVFASAAPDSLETIANKAGISARETQLLATPFAGYEWQGIPVQAFAKSSAGLAGAGLVFFCIAGVSRLLRRRSA